MLRSDMWKMINRSALLVNVGSLSDDLIEHIAILAELPEEAAVPPLPRGWSATTDTASGRQYYYTAAGDATWERPRLPAPA